MKAVFISDIHYKGLEDPRTEELLHFLDKKLGFHDYLVIVGDFFDFWIGYSNSVFSTYVPVLSKLYELVHHRNIKIIYVEGNHDFFLGAFFEKTLKAHIIRKKGEIEIFGKKIYLHHGDGLEYRSILKKMVLNTIVRSPFSYFLSRILGPGLIWKIGRLFSHASRHYGRGPSEIRERYRKVARDFLSKNSYDYFIVGHNHVPDQYEVSTHQFYFNTGDWLEHRTYLILDGAGKMTLFDAATLP